MTILKLDKNTQDEGKELDFELAFLKSLSIQERFKLMFQKSELMARLLLQNGHRKTPAIIQH